MVPFAAWHAKVAAPPILPHAPMPDITRDRIAAVPVSTRRSMRRHPCSRVVAEPSATQSVRGVPK